MHSNSSVELNNTFLLWIVQKVLKQGELSNVNISVPAERVLVRMLVLNV